MLRITSLFAPTTPYRTAGLAVLRALYFVAYEDIWKPRCDAVVTIEARLGITARRKRTTPIQRHRPGPAVDPALVPSVLNGLPHASSPSFSQSALIVSAIWTRALQGLVGVL